MTLNQVQMCVYLHDSQSVSAFTEFLSKINKFFIDNNVNGEFVAKYLITYSGADCPTDIKGCDLLLCVGPDKGGFIGPPFTPTVGFNTNPPYGFTQIGVQAGSHELCHFLGFQDLYWLNGDEIPSLPEIQNDIMRDPYTNSPLLSEVPVGILNLNLARRNSRLSILYPKYRVATSLKIKTDYPNTYYQLFARTRDYNIFQSVMRSSPIKTGYTDGSGIFTTVIYSGDDVDNNFDVYKVIIGSTDIWISCLVTEACYLYYGYSTECCVQGRPVWCKNLFNYLINSMPVGTAVEVDGTMVISRVVVQKTKAQGCGCKNRVVKVW